mgnify:CR=1 FL=1
MVQLIENPCANSSKAMINITLVGDLMFSRNVRETLDFLGKDAFFQRLAKAIPAGDLVVGNLETSISDVGHPIQDKDEHIIFCAPPIVAGGLKVAGFNLLALSNNHLGDYGGRAVAKTLCSLDKASLNYFGVSNGAIQQPYIYRVNGKKIAFLAYCTPLGPNILYGGKGDPGPIKFLKSGQHSSFKQIEEVKKTVDFLFVFMHWGHEHVHYPPQDVVVLGRKIVDAGADCIVGTHPHFVQGIEKYKEKTIFYSLGNFVFSEPYEGSRWSIAVKFHIDEKLGQSYGVVPITINDQGIPALADAREASKIREEVDRISDTLSEEISREVVHVTKEKFKWAIRNIIYQKSFKHIDLFPWGIKPVLATEIVFMTLRDYLKRAIK